MSQPPNGWEASTLGELTEVVSGSTPRTAEPRYWGGEIAWITPDDLSRARTKTIARGARNITQAGYESCSARLVPVGTVLYTSRAPIGYAAIAAGPVCTNQGFKSFVPSGALVSDYLYWFLAHATPKIRELGSGTTFPELSKSAAKTIAIPVPPLNEQRRIVAAIEEQFSRLDATDELLARAKAKTHAMQAAIVARAFARHRRVELGSVAGSLRYGTSVKCLPNADGPPVLRIPNIRDGRIDTTDLKFATVEASELGDCFVEEGDLLFVRTNGSRDLIGRVAVIAGVDRPAFASYLIRARPDPSMLDSRWAALALSARPVRAVIESRAATTAGQYNLNLQAIRSLEVPLPPLDEQHRIVAEVEQRLSVIDAMRDAIEKAKRRSATLRRSILERAFRGELVPQDPSDEPASVLLERIAAERATASAAGSRRPGRRATIEMS